jgi:hypothetical protein
MLRNVPVGAGRRKNKNGLGGAADDEEEDPARLLGGGGDDRGRQLQVLTQAAATAAMVPSAYAPQGGNRGRRDGSSDGSATEAEDDTNMGQPLGSRRWSPPGAVDRGTFTKRERPSRLQTLSKPPSFLT